MEVSVNSNLPESPEPEFFYLKMPPDCLQNQIEER